MTVTSEYCICGGEREGGREGRVEGGRGGGREGGGREGGREGWRNKQPFMPRSCQPPLQIIFNEVQILHKIAHKIAHLLAKSACMYMHLKQSPMVMYGNMGNGR